MNVIPTVVCNFYMDFSDWKGLQPLFDEYKHHFKSRMQECGTTEYWCRNDECECDDEMWIRFGWSGYADFSDCLNNLECILDTDANPLGKEIIDYIKTLGTKGISYQYCVCSTFPAEDKLHINEGYSYINENGDLRFMPTTNYDWKNTPQNRYDLGLIDDYFEEEAEIIEEIEDILESSLSESQLERVREAIDANDGSLDWDDIYDFVNEFMEENEED